MTYNVTGKRIRSENLAGQVTTTAWDYLDCIPVGELNSAVKEAGVAEYAYEYAPFGALTVSRGASAEANPFRFSSEYAEDDTATVYYNYRHYEPVMGRWMQRDPIEELLGGNLFACCGNTCGNDVLGLLKFEGCSAKVKNEILAGGHSVTNNLGALTKNDKSDELAARITEILKKYGVAPPQSWHKALKDPDADSLVRSLVEKVLKDIQNDCNGSTVVKCCPRGSFNPCNDPRNQNAAAAMKDNKIFLCDSGLRSPGKYGGYGCIVVHELIHKYGIRVYPGDSDAVRLAKERATVKISELLTGKSCPAPAYFKQNND